MYYFLKKLRNHIITLIKVLLYYIQARFLHKPKTFYGIEIKRVWRYKTGVSNPLIEKLDPRALQVAGVITRNITYFLHRVTIVQRVQVMNFPRKLQQRRKFQMKCVAEKDFLGEACNPERVD